MKIPKKKDVIHKDISLNLELYEAFKHLKLRIGRNNEANTVWISLLLLANGTVKPIEMKPREYYDYIKKCDVVKKIKVRLEPEMIRLVESIKQEHEFINDVGAIRFAFECVARSRFGIISSNYYRDTKKKKTTKIAIVNSRGGVGRTTITVTLGSILANRGYRVLLVDLSTLGHVALLLGLLQGDDISAYLFSPAFDNPQALDKYVFPSGRKNLDVLRYKLHFSDFNWGGFDRRSRASRFCSLADELFLDEPFQNTNYDYILFDSEGSYSNLVRAAIIGADWLLIPTLGQSIGIRKTLETYDDIVNEGKTECRFLGIVFNKYEIDTEFHDFSQDRLAKLISLYPDKLISVIPSDDEGFWRAEETGKTILEINPNSPAVTGLIEGGDNVGGYSKLAEHIIQNQLI